MEQSEFARINGKRINKIIKMIDTIETSARSNNALDECKSLLAIVTARIGGNPPEIAGKAGVPPETGVPLPRQWADAVQMARECDLEAGVAALGVIATRVEQELYEARQ